MDKLHKQLQILKGSFMIYGLLNIIVAICYYFWIHGDIFFLFQGLWRGVGILFIVWLMFRLRNKYIFWFVYISSLCSIAIGFSGLLSLCVVYFYDANMRGNILRFVTLSLALLLVTSASWYLSKKEVREYLVCGSKKIEWKT